MPFYMGRYRSFRSYRNSCIIHWRSNEEYWRSSKNNRPSEIFQKDDCLFRAFYQMTTLSSSGRNIAPSVMPKAS